MEGEVFGSNGLMLGVQRKRGREEEAEIGGSKRSDSHGLTPQALELLRVLEDLEDSECGEICHEGEDRAAAEEVVCGVMRSLQEEICSSVNSAEIEAICSSSVNSAEIEAICSSSVNSAEIEAQGKEIRFTCAGELVDGSNRGDDHMSYLLEASDDELGIPPSSPAVLSPLTLPCFLDAFWQFEEEDELLTAGYNDWPEQPDLHVYGDDQLDACNSVPFACNYVPSELCELDGRLSRNLGRVMW